MVADRPHPHAWRLSSYHRLYADRPDPIVFIPLAVRTSGRLYPDFSRLLFLQAHLVASALATELPC